MHTSHEDPVPAEPSDENDALRSVLADALREEIWKNPVPFPNSPAERRYLDAADALLSRPEFQIVRATPPASTKDD